MRGWAIVLFLLLVSPATCDRIIELEVEPGLKLGATLATPQGDGPWPAVVLVHGSGPNDRDETLPVGSTVIKPFAELSSHLTRRGVAVLRYDKRSYVLKKAGRWKDFEDLTPLDFAHDAQQALLWLGSQPEIDGDRLFVIGHSQGGTLAPWVCRDQKVKGMVLLAPALLPMRDQIEYQIQYQLDIMEKYNLLGSLKDKIEATQKVRDQFREIYRKIDTGKVKPGEMVGGASVHFYGESDRLGKEVVAEIVASKTPVLIINGTKDLKCPYPLIRSKEKELKESSRVTIHYETGMVHELYNQRYSTFQKSIVGTMADWMKGLEAKP